MFVSKLDTPPCGWNSYDSYGVYLDEASAIANIESFAEKLAPHGYEYFVIDACWYAKGDFMENYRARSEGGERFMHVDEYGRFITAPEMFPRGLKFIADKCHSLGVKFGVHIMRGIPTRAVELNTPVKGHPTAHARDIVDYENSCAWCAYVRGINMDAPGAQEYYDSVVEYLANDLEVDFIKLDDVVGYPREIEAFGKAISKVERPIVLSLSPGAEACPENYHLYAKYGNMCRITMDIWDREGDNDAKFDRWSLFEKLGTPNCWIDLDMIPIGGIQAHVPEGTPEEYQPVYGCRRRSKMSHAEKKVMMTQLALAKSPLFYGGDIPMSNDEDIEFVTNSDMLDCNRYSSGARRVFYQRQIDIRKSFDMRNASSGWIGIFNRKNPPETMKVRLTPSELGFGVFPSKMTDIWTTQELKAENGILNLEIAPKDVVFIKYESIS